MSELLEILHRKGVINVLDLTFAGFMARLSGTSSEALLLGAALVSHATETGDVCFDLSHQASKPLFWPDEAGPAVYAPSLARWRRELERSRVVGKPGEFKPLVLDEQDRLYLYRYWDYEHQLADDLKRRAVPSATVDENRLATGLARLFPPHPAAGIDWQKVAAAIAVLRNFSVISGAPGTGKTTTLAKILTLLVEQAGGTGLRIRLAAPTGKAAARMQEAIRTSKQALAADVDPLILAAIPEQASTLHRLLGAVPDSTYFRHAKDNPLPVDVLVIDEASMVDLPLMTKTVWALPPHARLILLGDKDQLSSVEAGAVLGDICGQTSGAYSTEFNALLRRLTGEAIPTATHQGSALQDSIALLRYSYRFGENSGIGRLARAVNEGRSRSIQAVLKNQALHDIRWNSSAPALQATELLAKMAAGYGPYLDAVRDAQSITAIFSAFSRFQVLCAQRGGILGVSHLNTLFEDHLKAQSRWGDRDWYPGRPVMVTVNDYNLKLFNGDIGITLPEGEAARLRVFFQGPDGGLRSFPVTRVPRHETVFAMTIHKSQGSEFDDVLLVLPAEKSRVLTRELIYTGITRARKRVDLWGDPDIMQAAAKKSLSRLSGLRAKLHSSAVPGEESVQAD